MAPLVETSGLLDGGGCLHGCRRPMLVLTMMVVEGLDQRLDLTMEDLNTSQVSHLLQANGTECYLWGDHLADLWRKKHDIIIVSQFHFKSNLHTHLAVVRVVEEKNWACHDLQAS